MSSKANQSGFWSRNRWLAWTVGSVAAVLLLASFMSRGDMVALRAATAQKSTIRSVVSTNGKVEPLENFEAHAPVATTVEKLFVKEGARVKKGQLLAQLDDASARSDAARALAQIRAADADLSAVERSE